MRTCFISMRSTVWISETSMNARLSVGYEFDWHASLNKVEEQSRMTFSTNHRPPHAHTQAHTHTMHTHTCTPQVHMKIEKCWDKLRFIFVEERKTPCNSISWVYSAYEVQSSVQCVQSFKVIQHPLVRSPEQQPPLQPSATGSSLHGFTIFAFNSTFTLPFLLRHIVSVVLQLPVMAVQWSDEHVCNLQEAC